MLSNRGRDGHWRLDQVGGEAFLVQPHLEQTGIITWTPTQKTNFGFLNFKSYSEANPIPNLISCRKTQHVWRIVPLAHVLKFQNRFQNRVQNKIWNSKNMYNLEATVQKRKKANFYFSHVTSRSKKVLLHGL